MSTMTWTERLLKATVLALVAGCVAGCGAADLVRCGPSGWRRAAELQQTSTELTEGIPAREYYAPLERPGALEPVSPDRAVETP
ncbi:MAG: hypothetical protein ACOCXX_00920 [Planctomycetota bacterium]